MPFCSPYYSITLPACPESIIIDGGLQPSTHYRWEITDKFGIAYSGNAQTDASYSLLFIDVAGNTFFPKGLFNEYAGVFVLRIFPSNSSYQAASIPFLIDDEQYIGIELRFKRVIGVGASGPVFVPAPDGDIIIIQGSQGQNTAIIPAGTLIDEVLIQAPEGTSIFAGLSPGSNDFFESMATGSENWALQRSDKFFPNTTSIYFSGVTTSTKVMLIPTFKVGSGNDTGNSNNGSFTTDEVAKLKQILNIDNTDQ